MVFGDDGPVRTVSGDLTISFGDDEDAMVSLQGVIHAPKGACAWPTAGTMVRTLPDATVHNLSFGPSCGEATLDGEPVDLDALQAEGHGRRGRHRPF